MNLQIPISEINSLAKEKTGRDVILKVIDSQTIMLCYEIKVNVPFLGQKSKEVSVDIRVEKVEGNDVYLQYSANFMGGDMIITRILSSSFLHKYKAQYTQADSTIILHLNKIPQIQEMLNKVTIHSISFDANVAFVTFFMQL